MPELSAFDLTQLHFLRPWWLAATPVFVLAIYYLWLQQSQQSGWQSIINAELLPHLLQGENKGESTGIKRLSLIGLAIIWLLACIAMAGPSWEKIPQPIHKSEQALVILLDVSPSMAAEDVKPSRMIRARLKLIDLLKQRTEGLTALVAFAGEAHTITPLTDDTKTIISLAPTLSPSIMPLAGSNPEMAIDTALSLFTDAGINQGDIILITDGITPAAADYISKQLGPEYRLSILGVGTDKGAPIPIKSGGFAKDKQGNIVLARLGSRDLSALSRNSGGHYQTLTATDTDIKILTQVTNQVTDQTRQLDREFDLWHDRGPWLLLPLLPLLLLCFRRGWLLSIVFIVLLPLPDSTHATSSNNATSPTKTEPAEDQISGAQQFWNNLWQTPDQQGKNLLTQGDASNAAKVFKDKQWAATAHYQANEFEQAADLFDQAKTADGHYNQGNAFAKAGKLEEAIAAYDAALEKNPELEDAQFNKALVEKLKQEQEKQEQQGSDQQDKSDEKSQESSEQNSEQSDSKSEQQEKSSESQSDSESNSESDSDSEQEQQSPNDSDSEDQEKQQEDQQPTNENEPEKSEQEAEAMAAEESESQPNSEQQQAMEQWLRKIPDDPSGLMRKKFEHQYYQRRKQYQEGTWQPPENDAINRW